MNVFKREVKGKELPQTVAEKIASASNRYCYHKYTAWVYIEGGFRPRIDFTCSIFETDLHGEVYGNLIAEICAKPC